MAAYYVWLIRPVPLISHRVHSGQLGPRDRRCVGTTLLAGIAIVLHALQS
jgi:hypothetical protein